MSEWTSCNAFVQAIVRVGYIPPLPSLLWTLGVTQYVEGVTIYWHLFFDFLKCLFVSQFKEKEAIKVERIHYNAVDKSKSE